MKKGEEVLGDQYTFTRTNNNQFDASNIFLDKLTITPKPGTPDFKSIANDDNSAELKGDMFYVRVLSKDAPKSKGTSSLRFEATGSVPVVSDTFGMTNWQLFVLTQDIELVTSAYVELPDTALPYDLVSAFYDELTSRSIAADIVSLANGSLLDYALTMTSIGNNYFAIGYVGNPAFIPLLANQVVPEPPAILLFGIGLAALLLLGLSPSLNSTRTTCSGS
jgi:hypothetical protein